MVLDGGTEDLQQAGVVGVGGWGCLLHLSRYDQLVLVGGFLWDQSMQVEVGTWLPRELEQR